MSEQFNGLVAIRDGADVLTIELNGNNANLYIGNEGNEGDIFVRDDEGRHVFHFNSNSAALHIGREDNDGKIFVQDGAGRNVLQFHGNHAALYLGAAGNEGDIFIRNNAGDDTVRFDGNEGDFFIRRKIDGVQRRALRFDASHADLYIGSEGNEGSIFIYDGAGRTALKLKSNDATLHVGAFNNGGSIIVLDQSGDERIRLDGNSGDIRLSGADCAEEFDIVEAKAIDPGTVLVIDDGGKLAPCQKSYDKKVAGVVSGANGYTPGIILDRNDSISQRMAISLTGKVYCKVDAQFAAVEVGDLLTTSPTIGHAMKATEPLQAFGAVIGKALRDLKEGRDFIPILVSLQ